MIKRQKVITKYRLFIKQHPKYLILIIGIVFLFLFGLMECIRARIYIANVSDYKNSANVMSLVDNADKLGKLVSAKTPAYYCNLNFQESFLELNPAFDASGSNQSSIESLVLDIHSGVKEIKPAPAFSSLLEFLPQPKKARAVSEELYTSVVSVEQLTTTDARSEYCLKIRDALATIYFLQDLQKPEGVSALSVGQLENFQVNVTNLQASLLSLKFPSIFEQQHTEFLQLLQKVAIDLRQDDNNYRQFSRTIEQDVIEIDKILARISSASSDMKPIPKDIILHADSFK